MLTHLHISNYILIEELDIDLRDGLTIVTGETGAGKSILLGAMGLLAGQRADSSTPADAARKCVVEGTFDISKLSLQDFFSANDLEYDSCTIIRREIMPDGRSRAFVNDSPVNLSILKTLSSNLIDIHSQQQQIYLARPDFQMKVTDSFAGQQPAVAAFRNAWKAWRQACEDFEAFRQETQQRQRELDYISFQYQQLVEAGLKEDEQQALEEEARLIAHTEEIKQTLSTLEQLFDNGPEPLLGQLRQAGTAAEHIGHVFPAAREYAARITQAYIDLKDLSDDIAMQNERIEYHPERMAVIEERLNSLYSLMQKHHVQDEAGLMAVRDEFKRRLNDISSSDARIESWEAELNGTRKRLEADARRISDARRQAIPQIEKEIDAMLQASGIPNGRFRIRLTCDDTLHQDGADSIQFLFAANRNQQPEDLAKVASGGELSRIMLSIKSVIAQKMALPTLIFDEIDTGISGETADKVGSLMDLMARHVQIINITHLPQIAAKGAQHFFVYKQDEGTVTHTHIKKLTNGERVEAIARMLSGTEVTEAALAHARILLGQTGEINCRVFDSGA